MPDSVFAEAYPTNSKLEAKNKFDKVSLNQFTILWIDQLQTDTLEDQYAQGRSFSTFVRLIAMHN